MSAEHAPPPQGSIGFSIYMRRVLVQGADAVAREDFGDNRSAYISDCVERDLTRRGKMPDSPRERVHKAVDELCETLGESRVQELLQDAVGAPAPQRRASA